MLLKTNHTEICLTANSESTSARARSQDVHFLQTSTDCVWIQSIHCQTEVVSGPGREVIRTASCRQGRAINTILFGNSCRDYVEGWCGSLDIKKLKMTFLKPSRQLWFVPTGSGSWNF